MKISSWTLVILTTCLIQASAQQDIRELLPPMENLKGWVIHRAPQIYPGDKLFDLINGGADIYYEYGFNQVVSVAYQDPSQNIILVEMYEMNDAPAAYGIFSLTQQTNEWCGTYGNLSALKNDYIAFWKGNFFVNVSWSSRHHKDSPPLAEPARLIAANINTEGESPYLVDIFKDAGMGNKLIFIRGNLALSNFYYFDFKDIFEIKEGVAFTPRTHHCILVRYEDAIAALSVLTSSHRSISGNRRFNDIAMSFQGYSCNDNKGNSILVRQVENYIAIIVGLVPDISLAQLMDEVTQKIENLQ